MALLRVTKGPAAGAVHAVFSTRQHTTIGRDVGVDVPLEDGRASRRHAAITLAHGYWVLKDLQSRNGTCLEGKRIDQAILKEGSAISIGATTLTFHPGETAPVPEGDLHGTIPVESLGEESGVFRVRARQPAMDREVRVDWLHPKRDFEEEGAQLLARALEDAAKLRGPGFLPLLAGSAEKEAGGIFIILKGSGFTTLAQKLPELLREPLATRVEVFRHLVDLVLACDVGKPAVTDRPRTRGGRGSHRRSLIRLPALDLAAFDLERRAAASTDSPQHVDYLPPECQKAPPAEPNGAAPFASAMYNLGAMGYHLLTGQKPMEKATSQGARATTGRSGPRPRTSSHRSCRTNSRACSNACSRRPPRSGHEARQEVLAAMEPPSCRPPRQPPTPVLQRRRLQSGSARRPGDCPRPRRRAGVNGHRSWAEPDGHSADEGDAPRRREASPRFSSGAAQAASSGPGATARRAPLSSRVDPGGDRALFRRPLPDEAPPRHLDA